MKNLKRILSVVLVVAMAFSLVTVAGAANLSEKYSDADQIKHQKAVDTLTELGVLNGLDDGSYGPNKTLTRAQMVKIAAYVMVGREITDGTTTEQALSRYASTVKFTDTNKGAWYMGPIGYAVARSVVAGNGMGTFSPERKVTYAEAAKMLLVALGYIPERSGLVGDDWIINTNRLANLNGLFDEIESYDVNAEVTRDNMAQMVYNMLQENVVAWTEDQTGNWGYHTVGKAVQYYFHSNYTTVLEGVVVANGYTNLGLADADDSTNSYVLADNDESTFTFNAANHKNINRMADKVVSGTDAIAAYKAGSLKYNPHTETVIYIPLADCYGQGTCSVKHNEGNPNCPKNTTDIFVKIDAASGEDVIGRSVDATFVGGNWEGGYTYAYVTAKDINKVETFSAHAKPDEQVVVNTLAQDVKIAGGTIVNTITAGGTTTAKSTFAKTTTVNDVAPFVLAKAEYATAYMSGAKLSDVKTNSDEVVTLIDNNGDGTAEYMIVVKKDLGTSAVNLVTKAVTFTVAIDTTGAVTERTYATPVGTELEAENKVLAYTAINGETIYNVLDVHAGKITHVSNASKRIYFDDADEFDFVSGLDTRIDKTSKSVVSVLTDLIGYSFTYYLDDADNIVWIDNAKDESVEALIYGVASTNDGTVTGATSSIAARIYTINVDGEKNEYDIPKSVVKTADALDTDIIDIAGENVETDYHEARYCKITLVDNAVKSIEVLDSAAPNYLLGSLVAGNVVATGDTTSVAKTATTSTATATKNIGDDTVVFNFVQKTTVPGTFDKASCILGDVTIGHGAVGVKDVVDQGNLLVTVYDDISLPNNTAEVMVTTLVRDGNLVNITNAATTDDTTYAVISKVDVENAKSNQHTLADGQVRYTWDIPCVGDVSTITLGSKDNNTNNIVIGNDPDDTSAKLYDAFSASDYLVLTVDGKIKSSDKVFGALVDDVTAKAIDLNGALTLVSAAASRIAVDNAGTVTTFGYASDSIVLLWNGVSFEEITLADALAKVDGITYSAANIAVVKSADIDTFANTVDVVIVTLTAI